MSFFIDQLQRKVYVDEFPKRIVSLVPSITELLADLNLNAEVVGITKFCVHPENWFNIKTRIGGTKNVNINKIISLQPDLIIANKEENVKDQTELLEKIVPVFITDVNDFNAALQMIEQIGAITNKAEAATLIIQKIKNEFELLKMPKKKLRVCYLIWKDPYMTIGGDTFIHSMLLKCGFENIFSERKRYPEITVEEIKNENFDVLLLSSEPYPFRQKHYYELQSHLPDKKILLVDGEMFSWYGSRLILTTEYFKKLHRELNFFNAKL